MVRRVVTQLKMSIDRRELTGRHFNSVFHFHFIYILCLLIVLANVTFLLASESFSSDFENL